MRRRIAVLLLIWLSFQFCWSAAALACGHEAADRGARHFGHHVHVHEKASGQAAHGQAAGLQADADCPGCAHLAHGAPLPSAAPALPAGGAGVAPAAPAAPPPPSPPPSPPERPRWSWPA